MNKNLPKLIKNIFPSDKKWTGIRSVGYRDLHLPFASIGRVDIIDLVNICIIKLNLCSLQERLTKVPPVMSIFWAFAKRPEPES